MSMKSLRECCTSRVTAMFLVVVLAIGVVLTLATASEAFEEHRSASAVTDLRLAVLSVLEIEETKEPTSETLTRLDNDIAMLAMDDSSALHAVDPESRTFVRFELDRALEHAHAIRDGGTTTTITHDVSEHQELESLLRSASVNATADAKQSERTTQLLTLFSFTILVLVTMNLLASRAAKTQEAARNDAFQAAALRLATLLDESSDATAILHENGSFSYKSARFNELFAPHEVSDVAALAGLIGEQGGQRLTQVMLATDQASSMFSSATHPIDSASSAREFAVKVTDLRTDPLVEGHLVTIRETTDDNQARRRLEALAVTDQLTGLPNRRALMKALDASDSPVAGLMMLDLDAFKRTNDTHGHEAGDQLLCAVAGRFTSCCNADQTLFRLGGDEFAVLAESGGEEELIQLGEHFLETLREPIALAAGFEESGVSIGIALHHGTTERTALLRRSDIALYSAKSKGGRCIGVLSPELEADSERQRSISYLLHSADLDDEFSLVFQPVVDSNTGAVAFVEALLRWHSPILGDIYPDQFITMAESSGRIVEIGLWVIRNALQELVSWRKAGLDPAITISVNVSPRQLEEINFVHQSLKLLHQFGVAPSDLIMEVTESALVEPGDEIVTRLDQLRAAGCLIACDDFGSGYSNLGQLMTLPLDIVKVDRLLLVHLCEMRAAAGGDEWASCDVMCAIAKIAGAMNASIVAEGVETEMQQVSLRASGIDYLQGYYFSRPVPSEELMRLFTVHDLASTTPTIERAPSERSIAGSSR